MHRRDGDAAAKAAQARLDEVRTAADVATTHLKKRPRIDNMRFGVDQARRGWLEPSDVLNTRGYDDLVAWLERRRR